MSGFVFSEKPITIESGEGPYLYDDNGNEYLDFGANYAVTPLGHSHPAVTDAIQSQAEALTYVQASYPNTVRTSYTIVLQPCHQAILRTSGSVTQERRQTKPR